MPDNLSTRVLPPSIPTTLQNQKIPHTGYDIDGRGEGLVWIDFAPEATDEQIAAAAAICQQFGKTLIQPSFKRGAALQAIADLTTIIDNIDTATAAQQRAALKRLAVNQRAMIKYLMRLGE